MQLLCAKNQATRAAQSSTASRGPPSSGDGGAQSRTLRHATLGPARSASQRLQTQGSRAILHHLLPFYALRRDIMAVGLLCRPWEFDSVGDMVQAVEADISCQQVP